MSNIFLAELRISISELMSREVGLSSQELAYELSKRLDYPFLARLSTTPLLRANL